MENTSGQCGISTYMWRFMVMNTSGYRHTIIGPTKRFSTYGGNPPENPVPST